MEKQISLGNKNLISVSTHTQACSALLLSFSKTRVIHLCRFCYFAISCWLFCNGTKMEAGPGVASAPCKAHTKLALSCGLWGLRRGDCPALRSAGAHTASRHKHTHRPLNALAAPSLLPASNNQSVRAFALCTLICVTSFRFLFPFFFYSILCILIAKNCKQRKYPLTGEQINKWWWNSTIE